MISVMLETQTALAFVILISTQMIFIIEYPIVEPHIDIYIRYIGDR